MSATGRSFVRFFGSKKNVVAQACCGHPPHCSTFSKTSTTSPLSLSKSSGTLDESHRTPPLSLLGNSSPRSPDRFLLTSAYPDLNSSIPHFSTVGSLGFAPPCRIANASPTLFSSPTSGQRLGIFILPNLPSSFPHHWLGDFEHKTCSSISTLDHTTDQLLMLPPTSSFLHPSSSLHGANFRIAVSCLPILG